MKGDFSRFTFNPPAHYTQLPLQQGRVLVDADWNEQAEIALYDQRVSRRAIIGPSGGPIDRAALRVDVINNKPWVGIGGVNAEAFAPSIPNYAEPAWYWVEGRTLTQEQAYPFTDQPHLTQSLPTAAGFYLAWVDVFERLLTALDVPAIREVAMGGPDHGTRMQQVWQVRLFNFGNPNGPDPTCLDVPSTFRPTPPTGRLHARAADPIASQDPCVVPRTAGYRRLENQLYRVEIRDGGDETTATFVWSRDNGIVQVRAVEGSYPATSPASIQVSELGRDELTRLTAGDFIEITDEARTLAGLPGYLCQIASVSSTTLILEPTTALALAEFDALKSPTVRRWNTVDESKHPGATYLGSAAYDVSVAMDADPGHYFDLEDGVQVRFEAGTYRTGDYWLIPARTTSGTVEFAATAQLPQGVDHHAAALGILHCDGAGVWRRVCDCRNLFPPLTGLTHLHYVGGDGQEALPGGLLAAPLEVAVTNGTTPVAGVEIEFSVAVPTGTPDTVAERSARGYLLQGGASAPDTAAGRFKLSATTDMHGIAAVRWVLGAFEASSSAGFSQQVRASVVPHHSNDPTGELHFNATQSIARQVQVDIAACATNEADPALQTVQALLGAAGIDPVNPSHQNVQHVLHQLLCRLNARHVPYVFPATPALVDPAQVGEVKSALDALYWLVSQKDDCCCLSDLVKKLADGLGGKQGQELCKALEQMLDGECSLLELTLGAAVNLVRVVHAIVLAFLDLQDAPGPDKAYAGLKLGDETGVELDAFIFGEGPGWFASRVEERVEQVEALGDRVLDLVSVTLEKIFEKYGIKDALETLAKTYGQGGEAWNGPATRLFILDNLWQKLFGSRRLDDKVLVTLRDLLLEIVRALWMAFVELLLCKEPLLSNIPTPQWLSAIDSDLGRAFERAFCLHGLVRELPEDRYGTPMDVHMVAPSGSFYPAGATWVVSNSVGVAGNKLPIFSRWRHDFGGAGPLPALRDSELAKNEVLPDPDFVVTVKDDVISVTVIDSAARRNSLHCLVELADVDGARLLLWSLPSQDVAQKEGSFSSDFPPSRSGGIGIVFEDSSMQVGQTVLVAGGPDDPPTLIGWSKQSRSVDELRVWPTGAQKSPHLVDAAELNEAGVPSDSPSSMHAFALDSDNLKPGQQLGLALTRFDDASGQSRQRDILVLLVGRTAQSGLALPWWTGSRVSPIQAWDLPTGVRVVGGAHDLIAFQDDGGESDMTATGGGSGLQRWALLHVEDVMAFPTRDLAWDNAPKSRELVIPDDVWHEGTLESVVHGNDGPWLQAIGPLSGRLGMYGAWIKGTPPLQRQMVRGAAAENGDSGILSFFGGSDDSDSDDGQSVSSVVSIEHDYMLQDTQFDDVFPRLLTVGLRTGDGTAVIEFNASPRS